ncbi:hypothetical protein [Acidovorax sp. Root219]|uniref:hypothetical protein n=1 Tax=Acidovorax sp. Root219 TaxID=1736493 RepID=UPI000A5CF2EC|nr:hypothetical protein [Acidovorax sp. Root219]
MAPRRQFKLDADLAALRKLAEDERRRVELSPLPVLSPEHQLQLEKFQALSIEAAQASVHELPLEVSLQLSLLGTKAAAENPYSYSDLPRWLGFETWLPRDALLLLAGVSPTAALVDWTYQNLMGAEIDKPTIRTASDLNGIYDRYSVPSPSDWAEDIEEIKIQLKEEANQEKRKKLEQELRSYEASRDEPSTVRRAIELRHRSNILGALSDQWFSGDHDPEKRYSPEHFISWALARGYQPEWYEWARSNRLLDDHEAVYRAPYFDPDSEDYPELLHIALRAWEETRAGGEGTPKQRIERFLKQRYPSLRPTTRELIAQIANWQRTGGRPKV